MVYTIDGNVNVTRRKRITITGAASGVQSNYQIKLAALTYAAAMQSDFDDLRFCKADMQTLIDAWLEDKTDDTSADVWAEFPTTPANGVEEDYWLYFGNDGVASDWDIDGVFLLGDDFPGSSLDAGKWDTLIFGTGGVTVAGGIATITPSSGANYHSTGINSVSTVGTNNILLEGRVYYEKSFANTARYHSVGFGDISLIQQLAWLGVDGYYYTSDSDRNGGIKELVNASSYPVLIKTTTDWAPVNTWFRLRFYYLSDGTIGKIENTNAAEEIVDATWLSQNKKIGLSTGYVLNYGGAMKVDYLFVRKHVANPPTAAIGTEQHQRRTPQFT